jgi:hypothetical protein
VEGLVYHHQQQGVAWAAQQPGVPAEYGHQQQGLRQHDPAAIELRIEWLEKEVHLLRTRIAKLERSGDVY